MARAVLKIPEPNALPGGAMYEPKWDGYLHRIVRAEDFKDADSGPCVFLPEGRKTADIAVFILLHNKGECAVEGLRDVFVDIDTEYLHARFNEFRVRASAHVQ